MIVLSWKGKTETMDMVIGTSLQQGVEAGICIQVFSSVPVVDPLLKYPSE